ncbi:hypothetical protein EVAR_57435_1 [Eumeta japonica]|uniref:Uncharacterized protein n=1 Tax=Eumeta variegata TaxID=151549 RepID=A0A4C1YA96_EUMVA|nr:hypothetical protein EVAR_57435_1 [Eumeta japonica]
MAFGTVCRRESKWSPQLMDIRKSRGVCVAGFFGTNRISDLERNGLVEGKTVDGARSGSPEFSRSRWNASPGFGCYVVIFRLSITVLVVESPLSSNGSSCRA